MSKKEIILSQKRFTESIASFQQGLKKILEEIKKENPAYYFICTRD